MSNPAYLCIVTPMTQPEKLSYTVREAALAVGVSEKSIRRAIDAGTLIAYYPTIRPLIKADDLMRWLTTDRATA